MPGDACLRQFEAPVRPQDGEAICCQSLQTRAVLEAGGAARITRQAEPVQGGAAAGFEVRLVPHARTIVPGGAGCKPRGA